QFITYQELHDRVCRLANALRERGVKKGDRVCIYMPMIPEAAYAMLACTRICAIHSIVFGGFSPEALKDRIQHAECQVVITSVDGLRDGQRVLPKKNAELAVNQCIDVHTCIVVNRTGGDIAWDLKRDFWYDDLVVRHSTECEPEVMDSEDPLFILYSYSSTG